MSEGPGAGFPELLAQYRLVRRLGSGGMGTVFEGVDRRVDTRVAIKLLHPHLAADPSYRERFEREAHVAALLRSPYTVHLLDYGLDQGFYYLIMPFVDGRSVADLLKNGPIPADKALPIVADVARALEEAEARNVVHRDIKPENILLDNDGGVKVADFGIARQIGSDGMTMPGGFVGTSAFAAPEQADGNVDSRTDIYAVGATLYTMLAGKPPFSGGPLDLLKHHKETPVPMGPLMRFPQAVQNIVQRCMEKDPADRYQRPSELVGAIERAAKSLETHSAELPAPTIAGVPLAEQPAAPGGIATAGANVAETVPGIPATQAIYSGATTGPMRMELAPSTGSVGSRTGPVSYRLTIHSQVPQSTEVLLQFNDPDDAVVYEMPRSVSVPPMGSSTAMVRVRPRKRRWLGAKIPHMFMVTADGSSSGVPPVSATGQLDDTPVGPILIGGGVAGVLAIAAFAAIGASALLGGDDNTPSSPGDRSTPEATATSTPRASGGGVSNTPTPRPTPDRSATSVWAVTPTPEPATATPTLVPTATIPPAPPANSIEDGVWTYNFRVTSNTCGSGLAVGETVTISYEFYEAVRVDGYIQPGEQTRVVQTDFEATLGTFAFTYPDFTVSYPFTAEDGTPGTATLFSTFTSPTSGSGILQEDYHGSAGTCTILFGE